MSATTLPESSGTGATKRFHIHLSRSTGGPVISTRLGPWEFYLKMLDEDTVTTKEVQRLHGLWMEADRERRVHQRREHQSAVPSHIEEIRADSPAEFIDLLKLLVSRSGVSAGVIAGRAPDDGPGKLGRSQVYSLLNRGVLPRRAAQVESLGSACGLDRRQVDQLLTVWADLHARRNTATSKPLVAAVPAPVMPVEKRKVLATLQGLPPRRRSDNRDALPSVEVQVTAAQPANWALTPAQLAIAMRIATALLPLMFELTGRRSPTGDTVSGQISA